ncbi:MAG: relaxase MobL [Acutalibacter sp.]|nr:relaxase MobL [Acutalibacter sp.]
MPKLVTKFKYLKPGARQSRGGYAKYIATREGVEKLDDSQRFAPTTAKQKKLISNILRDFPDSREMFEYEDYLQNQTMGAASEFITRAIEDNASQCLTSKTYADYIATRPRAERFGSHGLFTDDGVQVNLENVSADLNSYGGNVYTIIISLRREDAERLGFDNGSRWRDMLRTQTQALAENLKIPMEHLKWFAAFHNESHHPHVHLLAYSTLENEGYLTKRGVHNLRSEFAKDIFAQDLHCIYEQQTEYRDELRAKSKEKVAKLVEQINSGLIVDPQLKQMLVELSKRLKRHKGKKIYGYLSAGTKKLVDTIVDQMAQDSRIAALYDLWYRQRDEIFKTYSGNPSERLPLSQNPEFKPIRNAVVKAALGIEHLKENIGEQQGPDDPGYFSREYGGKKSWWTDEYKLARKYLYGSEDASPDPAQAIELLQSEADKGNGFALYDLGLMARNGFGCEKNNVLAQEQFRKALAAFMAEESQSKKPDYWQYRIGKMYAMGYGTEQDFKKAAEWYERAAVDGNPFAAYALGCLYRRGQGVEQDEARAIAYFQAAAAHGNEYAQRMLDSLHTASGAQSWSVTNAALRLLRQTAGIFQDRLRDLDNEHMRHTDRKLMSKIAEKKLAQGQKLGG